MMARRSILTAIAASVLLSNLAFAGLYIPPDNPLVPTPLVPSPVYDSAEFGIRLRTLAGSTYGSSGDDVQGYAPVARVVEYNGFVQYSRGLKSEVQESLDFAAGPFTSHIRTWGAVSAGLNNDGSGFILMKGEAFGQQTLNGSIRRITDTPNWAARVDLDGYLHVNGDFSDKNPVVHVRQGVQTEFTDNRLSFTPSSIMAIAEFSGADPKKYSIGGIVWSLDGIAPGEDPDAPLPFFQASGDLTGVALLSETETWFSRRPSITTRDAEAEVAASPAALLSGESNDASEPLIFRVDTDGAFKTLALNDVQVGESFQIAADGQVIQWDGLSPFEFSHFGNQLTQFSITGSGFTDLDTLRDFGIAFDAGGGQSFSVTSSSAVPEPTSLALWSGLGLMGLIVGRRRRKMALSRKCEATVGVPNRE